MASKTFQKTANAYTSVLTSLGHRLDDVSNRRSSVEAMQAILTGNKNFASLHTLLDQRHKQLFQCESNCKAIHGIVHNRRNANSPKNISAATLTK